MTVIYDPTQPRYTDEADVRDELTRVFDICHGCQRCVDRCTVFPSLFAMIDAHPDHEAGRMTPADQDRVVDQCVQCRQCATDCPYSPGLADAAVDVPRLMLRAQAMRWRNGQVPWRTRLGEALADMRRRKPFAGPSPTAAGPAVGEAVVLPSCGRSGCCGAPMLHRGDGRRFTRLAGKNVRSLAAHVRRGATIVVPDPACCAVITIDYLDYVGSDDAELVAAHTVTQLDTNLPEENER